MVDVVEETVPICIATDNEWVGQGAVLDNAAIHVVAACRIVFALAERVVVVLQRLVLVSHPLVVLLVVHRYRTEESDVLNSAFVGARNAAHTGISSCIRHIARHTAVPYRTITFIPACDAPQIGVFGNIIMAGFQISAHPAVLYRAIVVAGNAAHLSRIAHLDFPVHVEVLHRAILGNRFEESLVVGADTRVVNLDADGVTITVKRAFIARTAHRDPCRGGHVEVGIQDVVKLIEIEVSVVRNRIVPVLGNIGQFCCRADKIILIKSGTSTIFRTISRLRCRRAIPFVGPSSLHRCKQQQKGGKNSFYGCVFQYSRVLFDYSTGNSSFIKKDLTLLSVIRTHS